MKAETCNEGEEGTMGSKDGQKLNIVFLGHKRVPSREGGVEVVVEELATRMAAQGHNVTVLNRSGHHIAGEEFDAEDFKEYNGFRIKKVPTINRKGLAAATSSFFGCIQAAFGPYDIVHIHAEGPAFFSWIPKMMRKKVIVTVHGLDWQRSKWSGFASWYIRHGEIQAVKHADCIIVLSRNIQTYFWEKYHRKTVFIPNGVNKPDIKEAKEIKEKWGLDKDSFILYVGRIVPEKGLDILLKAWKGVKTDKKLVIAGSSSDTDEYFQQVKSLADNRVIFTGFTTGRPLKELYSNAYLYCLPSNLEGMPLTVLEAMSYGDAVLGSDIKEISEVVEDKALLFHKGIVEDLRNQLSKCIEHKEVVDTLRAESSSFILSKYDWKDVTERTINQYYRVLQKSTDG